MLNYGRVITWKVGIDSGGSPEGLPKVKIAARVRSSCTTGLGMGWNVEKHGASGVGQSMHQLGQSGGQRPSRNVAATLVSRETSILFSDELSGRHHGLMDRPLNQGQSPEPMRRRLAKKLIEHLEPDQWAIGKSE